MIDSLKDKFFLPLIYAAAVVLAAVIAIFMFFGISPSWLRFLPVILTAAGFIGGFALSFIPAFSKHKIIPIACITVSAVITGIIIAVLC